MNFSDILSKAKGDQKVGHKYKSRKPDGKGGWTYDYGDSPKEGTSKPLNEKQKAYAAAHKSGDFGARIAAARGLDEVEKEAALQSVETKKETEARHGKYAEYARQDKETAEKEAGDKLQRKEERASKRQWAKEMKSGGYSAEYIKEYQRKKASPNRHRITMENTKQMAKKSIRTDRYSDILSKAKGDQKAGHKYKSRKPDGKGSWMYDYGDGKGYRGKADEKPTSKNGKTTPTSKNDKREQVEGAESLSTGVKERLAKYNLNVITEVGSDPQIAVDIAKRLEQGISDAADVCKQSPPICAGNMGIPRADMPQIMSDSIPDMLKATNRDGTPDLKERAKGQAAVDAGADPKNKKAPFDMMLDHFKSEGIKVSAPTPIKVGSLKATQQDIQAKKTNMFAGWQLEGKFPNGAPADFSKDPIVISNDGHILDGHHRYAALLMLGKENEMKAITVDLPMHELLTAAFDVPGAGVFRMDLQNNVVKGDKPDYADYKKKADAKYASAKEESNKKTEKAMSSRFADLLSKAHDEDDEDEGEDEVVESEEKTTPKKTTPKKDKDGNDILEKGDDDDDDDDEEEEFDDGSEVEGEVVEKGFNYIWRNY